MAYIRESFFDPGIVNVDNNEILENELSLGRWIADALLLLLSLGESTTFQKRIEIKGLGLHYIPDIYLENGCKAIQWVGKTMIDIKNNLLYDTEIRQSEIYKYIVDNQLIDKLIVVYIHSNDSLLTNQSLAGRITLMKAEELIHLLKTAIKEGKGGVNKELRKARKRTWLQTRKSRMLNAINDFQQNNCVLFLGAGISASANVPNWYNLLKGLLSSDESICNNDYDIIFKEMDSSNLMMARYIQKISNIDKASLVNKVRNILYSTAKQGSELIESVCRMVIYQEKVRSIITYNYDTLIEDNLTRRGKRCFSVYKNNRDEGVSFPVYHVHGVVFHDNSNGVSENIVLSEEDYHKVYSEVFDWSNVEQLHALTRCTCFFIGLSMKDPNMRRLLEIAKRGSGTAVRHYVFLERKSLIKDKRKSEVDFQIRENILADLGLSVIWYKGDDGHKELPELLKQFTTTRG